jgi:N-acetylglucosaminyldiphosphoundecaprenol N-acetyl-beta-D-mannosaminyltransferase
MSVFVLPDPDSVTLGGLRFAALTEGEVVHRVRAALARGIGGRIATPNVDILRQAELDASVRADLETADLLVADGAPLVWAARLAGTPLPERVTGSGLIWSLSYGLAQDGSSIYLLGGDPATEGAARAASLLSERFPGLRIAGAESPPFGFERSPSARQRILQSVVDAEPDLVFVGLGFPKQERLIEQLRPVLPTTWFLGCGAAINFVAGDCVRAPVWMQRSGLEWAHRLAREPRRLARRYLREDAPYAMRLLATSAMRRDREDPDEWEDVLTPAEREEWLQYDEPDPDHIPSAADLAVPGEPRDQEAPRAGLNGRHATFDGRVDFDGRPEEPHAGRPNPRPRPR